MDSSSWDSGLHQCLVRDTVESDISDWVYREMIYRELIVFRRQGGVAGIGPTFSVAYTEG